MGYVERQSLVTQPSARIVVTAVVSVVVAPVGKFVVQKVAMLTVIR